jgi:hypothetical protein
MGQTCVNGLGGGSAPLTTDPNQPKADGKPEGD